MKRFLLLIALLIALASCTEPEQSVNTKLVCTTGMLADACAQLLSGLDSIELTTLMGPGTDPHLYKASQSDVMALSRADLIIYNGLHLEGKMTDLFSKLPEQKVYAAAERIPEEYLINASDYVQAYDPHVWFDLKLWSIMVDSLAYRLKGLIPSHSSQIEENRLGLLKNFAQLDSWARNKLSEIPESQRVLVTAHDAFKYFGLAYNVEVRGLQGISTTAEFGVGDVSALASFIAERKIKAVFVENSIDPRSIEAVIEAVEARGSKLKMGGELYSDALGSKDGPAATFEGMFKTNVQTISSALY